MKFFKSLASGALAGVSLLTAVANANAGVITFDALSHAGNGLPVSTTVDTYTEGGLTFIGFSGAIGVGAGSTALGSLGSATASPPYLGQPTLINRFGGGATQLVRDGGGTFDLASIDLAEGNDLLIPSSFFLVGNIFGGGTVSTLLTVDGVLGLETFVLTGFTNLVSVNFNPVGLALQIDNVVTPMSEPGTLAILGLGLAGLGLARRRRQRGA